MPSKSKAQHNLMAMVANNPKAAKRLGIPQSVGEDYMKADKAKKEDTTPKSSAMGKVKSGGKKPNGQHSDQRRILPFKNMGDSTRFNEIQAEGMKKGGSVAKKKSTKK